MSAAVQTGRTILGRRNPYQQEFDTHWAEFDTQVGRIRIPCGECWNRGGRLEVSIWIQRVNVATANSVLEEYCRVSNSRRR
jgi:hypothetical protein